MRKTMWTHRDWLIFITQPTKHNHSIYSLKGLTFPMAIHVNITNLTVNKNQNYVHNSITRTKSANNKSPQIYCSMNTLHYSCDRAKIYTELSNPITQTKQTEKMYSLTTRYKETKSHVLFTSTHFTIINSIKRNTQIPLKPVNIVDYNII